MEQGSNMSSGDFSPQMALQETAKRGNTAAVHQLIANGISANTADEGLRTPLHCAAMIGHTAAINILMSSGGDPFATDVVGQMPLHIVKQKVLPVLLKYVWFMQVQRPA